MFDKSLKKEKNYYKSLAHHLMKLLIMLLIQYQNYKKGNHLYFAGNGGSVAEAQHMSAEYLATLNHNNFRKGVKALALTTDTSFITAWTNDFGYDDVFSRQIETFANKGDVFYAYSTSGNSKNIIRAIKMARSLDVFVVGLTETWRINERNL